MAASPQRSHSDGATRSGYRQGLVRRIQGDLVTPKGARMGPTGPQGGSVAVQFRMSSRMSRVFPETHDKDKKAKPFGSVFCIRCLDSRL